MRNDIRQEITEALKAAQDARDSHDTEKIARAHLRLQMAQFGILMDRGFDMPTGPAPGPKSAIAQVLATVLGTIVGVAAVLAIAFNLMDSRISDLGARVSTVESRLVNIDAGISDLRAQTAAIAGELRGMNSLDREAPAGS